MIKHTVCLCSTKDLCEETTKAIANSKNAHNWLIEPVYAPLTSQVIYKGIIIKEI